MNSTLISPARISVIKITACPTETNWLAMVRRTRSTRSATAPAIGEMMTDGARLQNAMIATQRAEWVNCHASQSVAMRWIHDPVQHTMLPE
jgi:hypothetical protein